jgi:hypothetical protein
LFFIFKKTKIVLDCFITDQRIIELFPIQKSSNVLPNWWKALPKEVNFENCLVPISTIKRCPGFKDLFSNSLTIPSWGEYKLFLDSNTNFSYISPNHKIEAMSHSNAQFQNAFKDHGHLKLISPWFLKEKQGVKFNMIQSVWHFHDPSEYLIPPGILEFKYQHATHINLISKVNSTKKEINIAAGDPLVHLIPLSDKEIDVKLHVISDKECESLKTYHHSFHNSYEKTKKIFKEKYR